MATMLTPEDTQRLIDQDPVLREVKADIARLKRAGVDTTTLEQEHERVSKLRAGLLKEFGAPQSAARGRSV